MWPSNIVTAAADPGIKTGIAIITTTALGPDKELFLRIDHKAAHGRWWRVSEAPWLETGERPGYELTHYR